jgi:mRNA-degrading endonuclease RelE of RelBE toxin-antitoxin system
VGIGPLCHSADGGILHRSRQPERAGAVGKVDGLAYLCQYIRVYTVRYSRLAHGQLLALRAYDARRIVEAVDHLAAQPDPGAAPGVKLIGGLKPPWIGKRPFYQLRVGDHRVFFDIDGDEVLVLVQAVRRKGRKRTEEVL